jgi:hypothetical protein
MCLFTQNMDAKFHEAALRFGIRVEDASPWLSPDFHVQSTRYFMYRDFVTKNRAQFDRIFISDIRDAYFQGDPFNTYFPAELTVSIEDIRIKSDIVNSKWVLDLYGDQVLDDIKDNFVACSGTTLGSTEGMIRYLGAICELMTKQDFARTDCYDQGFYNYIVWKLRPDFAVIDWDDVVVQTVGCTPPDNVTIQSGDTLIRGRFAPVIHQWDRHALLIDHVATHPRFRMPT